MKSLPIIRRSVPTNFKDPTSLSVHAIPYRYVNAVRVP